MNEKAFPKECSRHQQTMRAFSVEVSPISHDIKALQGHGTWFRERWYPVPLLEVPKWLGVPNADTGKAYPEGLFTRKGAEAIKWIFLAQAEKELQHFEWDTRIIRHKIVSTYCDTEVKIELQDCIDDGQSAERVDE